MGERKIRILYNKKKKGGGKKQRRQKEKYDKPRYL